MAAPDTGQSSFRFVEAHETAANAGTPSVVTETSGDYYREAEPILPLATPVYPAEALAAKAGLAIVGVHITVSKEGRVSDVGPSALAVSIPTKFDAEFQEAVRAAVSQWRFKPAQTYHVEIVPMTGGGSYRRESGRQNAETSFDLSFTFTATGAVLGGASGK